METIEKRAQSLRGAHLWLVLWKAFDALQVHAFANIHSLGLGLSDFGVLEVLLHKGPLPVNVLGQKIRLTSGSISIAIDRLEEKGLVERKDDPDDRRARIVHLTSEGRKLIAHAFTEGKDPSCHQSLCLVNVPLSGHEHQMQAIVTILKSNLK